jgi:hypothetical protein
MIIMIVMSILVATTFITPTHPTLKFTTSPNQSHSSPLSAEVKTLPNGKKQIVRSILDESSSSASASPSSQSSLQQHVENSFFHNVKFKGHLCTSPPPLVPTPLLPLPSSHAHPPSPPSPPLRASQPAHSPRCNRQSDG